MKHTLTIAALSLCLSQALSAQAVEPSTPAEPVQTKRPSSALNPDLSAELKLVTVEERKILEQAYRLTLEDKAYLAYLFARLNRPWVANALAEEVLEADPANKNLMLVMASMYAERGDAENTLRYAERLVERYPNDHQARYFEAASHYLAGHYHHSRELFREIKEELFGEAILYPYEPDRAGAALEAGSDYEAIRAYQTILRDYQVSDELRQDVRIVLDSLYRKHLPQTKLTGNILDYGSGESLRFEATAEMPLRDQIRFQASAWTERHEIAESNVFNEASEEHSGWHLQGQMGFGGDTIVEARVGEYAEDFAGRVEVSWLRSRDQIYSLSAEHGRPATDTLALRFLRGRESRLAAELTYPLHSNFALRVEGALRRLEADGQRIGEGGLLQWSLERAIQLESPRIIFSYRGALARFEPDLHQSQALLRLPLIDRSQANLEASLRGLTSEILHREGLSLVIADEFGERWGYQVDLSADYFFHQENLGFGAGAHLLYRPRKSIELRADLLFSTTDQTGDASSETLQLILSSLVYF